MPCRGRSLHVPGPRDRRGCDDAGDADSDATTVGVGTAAPAPQPSVSTTTGGATSSGVPDDCDDLEELASYNASAPQMDPDMEWADIQAELVSRSEDAERLYGQAIDGAPNEIVDDLETLRDYTEEVLEAVRGSDSLEEFNEAFTELGAIPQEAVVNIDTILRERCGFGLSQN